MPAAGSRSKHNKSKIYLIGAASGCQRGEPLLEQAKLAVRSAPAQQKRVLFMHSSNVRWFRRIGAGRITSHPTATRLCSAGRRRPAERQTDSGNLYARWASDCENTVAYNLGRRAPYAERLLFKVPKGGTEDLDKSEISGPILHQAGEKVRELFGGRKKEATERRIFRRRPNRSAPADR